jgi:hypothetical protein
MPSTNRPAWGRALVGVACFGLYCAVGSALLLHLVANVSPTDTAVPSELGPHHALTPEMTRYPVDNAGLEPQPVVVVITIHGPTLSFTFLCKPTPGRVSSDAIEISAQEFGDVYRDLGCNQQPPISLRD